LDEFGAEAMKNEATKIARIFFLLSILVILTFLWRFSVPAHEESESNLLIGFEILFELAVPVGLVGLFLQLRARYEGSKLALGLTFAIALAASIGILFMRFSTTDGWYTGHRLYQPGYGSLKIAPQLAATPSNLGGERRRHDFVPVQFVRLLDGA
jgi:hypothetical protein